ncbi:hypothetical protein AMR72_14945 [Flavobacterium psychrophilum]|nr:hypothetical protein AMR72_14945 [Flavobacterium psychrophilum]AOE53696.1 hypothetical protein ALW18_14935 [Flavobacterium psychrophilum]
MKKTLTVLIVLVVINVLIVPLFFLLSFDDLGVLIISVFSIAISLLILIIVFVVELRTRYVAKNAQQRVTSRKRGLIIVAGIIVVFAIIFIVVSFNNGYKIPQRDRHKDWSEFPKGSNPDIAIDSINGLYITNIDLAPGSDYYFIHFISDTISYDQGVDGVISFGIMDKNCNMIVKYEDRVSVYTDTNRIIVVKNIFGQEAQPDFCDVYDTRTLKHTKEKLNLLEVPARFKYYPEPGEPVFTREEFYKRYRSDFFDTMTGLKEFLDIPSNSEDYRGYGLYVDTKRNIYTLKNYEDNTTLDVLCGNCNGYNVKNSIDYKNNTKNIVMHDASIISDNHLSSGISLGFGNPNGGGGDMVYFNYYQTWLMYYTIHLGDKTTSFKAEGGDKDIPYLNFIQLNEPKNNSDTLYLAANTRLWKVYARK